MKSHTTMSVTSWCNVLPVLQIDAGAEVVHVQLEDAVWLPAADAMFAAMYEV